MCVCLKKMCQEISKLPSLPQYWEDQWFWREIVRFLHVMSLVSRSLKLSGITSTILPQLSTAFQIKSIYFQMFYRLCNRRPFSEVDLDSGRLEVWSDSNESHSLLIRETFAEDRAVYSCVATNEAGSDVTECVLHVECKWKASYYIYMHVHCTVASISPCTVLGLNITTSNSV